MLGFQQYQASFTAHLRDPRNRPKPKGVNHTRMGVYREIVFNHFYASVSACFPVLRQMIGKRKFSQLARSCFAQHAFHSPFFRDIPKTLVDYLQSLDLAALDLPPYSAQLAHYEWAELAVSHLPSPENKRKQPPNLLDDTLTLNPAHMLVQYDYPVHRLSKRHAHSTPEATFILIHRNADFQIKFTLLNALTYQLLQLIQQGWTGRQALTELAQLLKQPLENIVAFGNSLLEDFQQQGVFVECLTK